MQIKITLDEKAHKDIISLLIEMANGGSLPKVLVRVICEWFLMRNWIGPIQAPVGPIQAPTGPESTNAGPDVLANALASIEEGWE